MAAGIEVRSVLWFHAVAPWSTPQRIHYCGRDFKLGGVESAAQAENVEGVASFRQLTRGPLLQPIYGHPAGAQQRALGAPCAMVLYMRGGQGYDSYALAGGP